MDREVFRRPAGSYWVMRKCEKYQVVHCCVLGNHQGCWRKRVQQIENANDGHIAEPGLTTGSGRGEHQAHLRQYSEMSWCSWGEPHNAAAPTAPTSLREECLQCLYELLWAVYVLYVPVLLCTSTMSGTILIYIHPNLNTTPPRQFGWSSVEYVMVAAANVALSHQLQGEMRRRLQRSDKLTSFQLHTSRVLMDIHLSLYLKMYTMYLFFRHYYKNCTCAFCKNLLSCFCSVYDF